MASIIVILVSIYALKLQRKLGRQIVPSSSVKLQKQEVSTVESTDSRRSSNAQRIVPGLRINTGNIITDTCEDLRPLLRSLTVVWRTRSSARYSE